MNIICEKCTYEISKTAITMHLINATATFIAKVLPYLPKTKNMSKDIIQYIKSLGEEALLTSANISEINCPICHKYEYWTTSENLQKINELSLQQNNTISSNSNQVQ